jgi:hypothetical protein
MDFEGTTVSPQARGDESEYLSAEDLGEREDDRDGVGYKPLGSKRTQSLYTDRRRIIGGVRRVGENIIQLMPLQEVTGSTSWTTILP